MKTLKGLWFDGIVSPLRLRLFVWLSLITQILIVVTGGAVRLTGSGLGCPTWPKCTDDSLISTPEMGFHGVIEFGNRLLTIVLLVIALLTFIVVVRLSDSKRGVGLLSIGFFSGALMLVIGLVFNEMFGLAILTLSAFVVALGMMLGFGIAIVRAARLVNRAGLVVPAFGLGVGIILQAVIGGITVLVGLNSWIVGFHFLVSTGLIAIAALLVWRALPKPGNAVASWNSNLAWPTVVVGFIAICMGVIVTGAGPHAGDAMTPRKGFNLEIWQHIHSYPGYTLLALITVQLVAQVWKSKSALRQLESRILLLLFIATVLQAVVGVVQARLGVPPLLVGIHLLGSGVITALITFQVLSARKINR